MSWFSRCSWCGGPFNGGNCRHCTNAANLSNHTPEPSRRFICYDNDDYEESTIPLNEIVSQIPPSIAITLVLPTLEHENSFIMGNEELSTISEKESDEVINSSVEDFVPIPSESDDTSGSDSKCDLPACDDFSPINIPEGKSVTFSNPLFDSNDDLTSSDDESLSDEDVPKNNVKIFSNPLFEFDDEYISITPLFDSNEDECFDPEGDVDKINAFDISLDFEDGYYDSEGDVLYHESLLSDDTTPNLPPKDRHDLSLTYVIRIFLPYFTYPVDSSFLLSSRSEDTIFDPHISAFHFSSLEPVASHWSRTFMCFNVYPNILNESPMEICSSTRFNPNITMIWEIPYGESKVHIEVLSVLWGNRLPIRTVRGRCLGHAGNHNLSYWFRNVEGDPRVRKDGWKVVIDQGPRLKHKDAPPHT
nr:hypothetical protein [Tanacetum cinerariifolium]